MTTIDFGLEHEELGLIYGNGLVTKAANILQISFLVGARSAAVNFTVPPDYPNAIPDVSAEISGMAGDPLEKFLKQQAATMLGLPMLAYLVGEARDFLAGVSDKEIMEQQEHVTQTPFSRERFLLWLAGFNEEVAAKQSKIVKPKTGRQMFEEGLVKPTAT
jgi:hypothetical protein